MPSQLSLILFNAEDERIKSQSKKNKQKHTTNYRNSETRVLEDNQHKLDSLIYKKKGAWNSKAALTLKCIKINNNISNEQMLIRITFKRLPIILDVTYHPVVF